MTLDAGPNPYATGTAEADEWEFIVARLADPTRERRLARALADRERAARGAPFPQIDPVEHAAHVEQLAAAGVLFGPDCSQFQGRPNWGTVRAAGCTIGGYKVAEGMTYTDPSHAYNKAAVPAAGLVPIAYHYMSPTSPAAAQADYFCSLVDPNAWHQLDVEAPSAAGLDVDTWVARYFTHFPNKTLGVYSNHGMWTVRSHVHTGVPGGRVVTWHAGRADGAYTSATGSLAAEWANTSSLHDSMQQLGFPPARFWQFTDHAQVPGVAGTCDGNAFLGTLAELRALATGTTTPGDDEPVTPEAMDALIDRLLQHTVPATADGPQTVVAMLARAAHYSLEARNFGQQLVGATDTLEASEAAQAKALAAIQAAQGDDVSVATLTQVLNDKLGTGPGGVLSKADVVDALQQVISGTKFVPEGPAA